MAKVTVTEAKKGEKSEYEVILDALLKISEAVIATQKAVLEIQKQQRAGRF